MTSTTHTTEMATATESEPKTLGKNVKGNRLVVVAEYHAPMAIFKIPDGVDLQDKAQVNLFSCHLTELNLTQLQVKQWHTRYNTLYIEYVDGKVEEVEWEDDPETAFKRAKEATIEDAEEFHVEYSEDEEGE